MSNDTEPELEPTADKTDRSGVEYKIKWNESARNEMTSFITEVGITYEVYIPDHESLNRPFTTLQCQGIQDESNIRTALEALYMTESVACYVSELPYFHQDEIF